VGCRAPAAEANMQTSIIVTCYNNEDYIVRALDSVEPELSGDNELLICDDASQDSSAELISKWMKGRAQTFNIKFLRHARNYGVTTSLNELIADCSGEIISPLAGDDYYINQTVYERTSMMLANPHLLGAFSDGMAVGPSGEVFAESLTAASAMRENRLKNDLIREVIYNWCEPVNIQFWRRAAFSSHGGSFSFQQDLFSEDLDFGLKAMKQNAFGYLPKVCYAYRCRSWPQSAKGDLRPKWRDMAAVFMDNAPGFPEDTKDHMVKRANYYTALTRGNDEEISSAHHEFITTIQKHQQAPDAQSLTNRVKSLWRR
jgi:glycosyltransferase involved in cell wall biosynthesis